MAKSLSVSSGSKARVKKPVAKAKPAVKAKLKPKPGKYYGYDEDYAKKVLGVDKLPKRLSKYAEWCLANPNGLEYTYIDWEALGLTKRQIAEMNLPIKPKPKSKRLSKIGEWWLKHPHGMGGTYDMKAVMK